MAEQPLRRPIYELVNRFEIFGTAVVGVWNCGLSRRLFEGTQEAEMLRGFAMLAEKCLDIGEVFLVHRQDVVEGVRVRRLQLPRPMC